MSTTNNQIDAKKIDNLISIYNPAVSNLFTVKLTVFGEDTSSDFTKSFVKYHATAVKISGSDSLAFKRHPVIKNILVTEEGYSRADKVSITWRETDDWSVARFHEKWISRFYNRDGDYYISYGYEGDSNYRKFKDSYIEIILPRPLAMKSIGSSSDYLPIKDSQGKEVTSLGNNQTLALRLDNVFPSDFSGFAFEWTNSPAVVTREVSYFFQNWKWEVIEIDNDTF